MKQRILELAIMAPVVALLGLFVYWCYRDTQEENPTYSADYFDLNKATGEARDPITGELLAIVDPTEFC